MCEDGIFVLGTTFKVSGELSFCNLGSFEESKMQSFTEGCVNRKLDKFV